MLGALRKKQLTASFVKHFKGNHENTIIFHNKVYENFETVRSYSDKLGIENKQKFSFLLISAYQNSLCLDIQT